jgi:hypothetical protein
VIKNRKAFFIIIDHPFPLSRKLSGWENSWNTKLAWWLSHIEPPFPKKWDAVGNHQWLHLWWSGTWATGPRHHGATVTPRYGGIVVPKRPFCLQIHKMPQVIHWISMFETMRNGYIHVFIYIYRYIVHILYHIYISYYIIYTVSYDKYIYMNIYICTCIYIYTVYIYTVYIYILYIYIFTGIFEYPVSVVRSEDFHGMSKNLVMRFETQKNAKKMTKHFKTSPKLSKYLKKSLKITKKSKSKQ